MKDSEDELDKTAGALGPEIVNTATSHSQLKNDLFRELSIFWLATDLIDAAPRRVRRALKKQIEGVVDAITAFGFRVPILVQKTPGGERYQVVDGHSRLEAARRLGAEQLPCILVDDLSDADVRRLTLSLNKLQETGQWDHEALTLEINEIIEIDGDISIPGFDLPEIEAIRFGVGETGDADPADTISEDALARKAPVACPGDVWILGDHRLLCGTARDGAAIAAQLDGDVADVIFTDAPYNVPISGHVSTVKGRHPEFAEASGEMTREDFVGFLAETIGNATACLKPGGVLFSCMDWRHAVEMSEALDALGLNLLNICVWVKDAAGMGGLYRSQHEFVFVAMRPGDRALNNVQLGKYGRNRSNVWSYAGATGGARDANDNFKAHPTVKPIRMFMDALLDVSAHEDIVLDPFLGSGTTLLAAERTGRRCIGVEIEPRYIDLAIRRWQEMTGDGAIQTKTGKTFEELALLRGDDDATSAVDGNRDGAEVS